MKSGQAKQLKEERWGLSLKFVNARKKTIKWVKLPEGVVKINSDGAYMNSKGTWGEHYMNIMVMYLLWHMAHHHITQ